MNIGSLQRRLALLLPEARAAIAGSTLRDCCSELRRAAPDQRNGSGRILAFRRHVVHGSSASRFLAFLDGIQRSRVAAYIDGARSSTARLAAVARARDRRMHTWHSRVETRIYAPRRTSRRRRVGRLAALESGELLGDTTDGATSQAASHPLSTLGAAVHRVQAHREAARAATREPGATAKSVRFHRRRHQRERARGARIARWAW